MSQIYKVLKVKYVLKLSILPTGYSNISTTKSFHYLLCWQISSAARKTAIFWGLCMQKSNLLLQLVEATILSHVFSCVSFRMAILLLTFRSLSRRLVLLWKDVCKRSKIVNMKNNEMNYCLSTRKI